MVREGVGPLPYMCGVNSNTAGDSLGYAPFGRQECLPHQNKKGFRRGYFDCAQYKWDPSPTCKLSL